MAVGKKPSAANATSMVPPTGQGKFTVGSLHSPCGVPKANLDICMQRLMNKQRYIVFGVTD